MQSSQLTKVNNWTQLFKALFNTINVYFESFLLDLGIQIRPLAENMTSLMDIKVYGHAVQTGTNACENSNKCSYICVGAPKKTFSCLCPDGMTMAANGDCLCPGSLQPQGNKTCPQISNTCAPGFFTCSNKLCIPNIYRCDGDDGKFKPKLNFTFKIIEVELDRNKVLIQLHSIISDCGDHSDESGCPSSKHPCLPHMFQCKSDNKCIPEYFACDHDNGKSC